MMRTPLFYVIAGLLMSDYQFVCIDIAGTGLVFIHLLDLAFQTDIAGAIQLAVHPLAALAEMNGDVTRATEGDIRIADIPLRHFHIARADQRDFRRQGIQSFDHDIA